MSFPACGAASSFAELKKFYEGKRVFVTGHTGFKGSWLLLLLDLLGADVCGYALPPERGSLFSAIRADKSCESVCGDVCDLKKLRDVLCAFRPQIVFHLAAQSLVLEGYAQPVRTFSTNVLGTVHLLESVRSCADVKSVVNVTTDKVYKNDGAAHLFSESDALGGTDPYSGSKACSEIVTESYRAAYLEEKGIALSSVRAGNVIGGGDRAADRILPDCVRAAERGEKAVLRNPHAVRPYQHVLDALRVYLILAARQTEDMSVAGGYNVAPAPESCIETQRLAQLFCEFWGEGAEYVSCPVSGAPAEAPRLVLDPKKTEERLSVRPVWDVRQAVKRTVEWENAVLSGEDAREVSAAQIGEFFAEMDRTGEKI